MKWTLVCFFRSFLPERNWIFGMARSLSALSDFDFSRRDCWCAAISRPFEFDEVNLRFYVRRQAGNEVRRGVVFIREMVPRWTIAFVARTFYNENYVALPMTHEIRSVTRDA